MGNHCDWLQPELQPPNMKALPSNPCYRFVEQPQMELFPVAFQITRDPYVEHTISQPLPLERPFPKGNQNHKLIKLVNMK